MWFMDGEKKSHEGVRIKGAFLNFFYTDRGGRQRTVIAPPSKNDGGVISSPFMLCVSLTPSSFIFHSRSVCGERLSAPERCFLL